MTKTTTKSKTTKSSNAAKAFPAEMFNVQTMDVPAGVREFAEKSIEQAKDGYARIKTVAEDATDIMEDSFQTSRQGALEINMKALDAAKDSADATFAFARDLLNAKSFAEAIEIQSTFARERAEQAVNQTREFQGLFTKVVTEASKPAKDVFAKTVKGFSTAS